MTRFVPLLLFVILVVFLGVGLRLKPKEVPSPLIGKAAPSFDLPRVKNLTQKLRKQDLLGKVYLMNVWASWCSTCREEHPLFLALSRSKKVPIYGINYKDEHQNALRWLATYGDPYLASGFDHDGRNGIEWGVYGTPETFVVDQQGRIRHKTIGAVDEKELRETILPLVQKLRRENS